MTAADLLIVNTLSDPDVVALTLWAEGRGGSPALRIAIAAVIQARVRAKWARSARAACLTHGQFSCWLADGSRNHASLMDAAQHLHDGRTPNTPLLEECLDLGTEVCADRLIVPAPLSAAVYYYAPAAMIPPDAVPPFARGRDPLVQISGTRFYGETA